ncbi:peptide-methionine (S)-S-oxide reductase MsrA [Flavobacterium sp. ASW18X]|uniref:peptide-methionine (S)-S-oxide reductase MsrA n=1 Tax=Flavobacterium sp. ASW18X TaxID=2572595 RepID=UPI0010AEE6BC|nr:peptide-methionine (S)-S-oxide reductase MsrA [Flavobacterium sp. ASW18X]TKD66160.1 peptide-methionine (S)-S-oxide reductase MsrA [Flavobacterium sp. ASW18X]
MNKQNIENTEIAILANGCFWCTEAVFQRLKGVKHVVSGYTGGHIKNPPYREVCTGRTGHAEAIKVTFNPDIITYSELLEVFFATHDPTTLNRQGNDVGTQYRSEIFYTNMAQKAIAEAFIKELDAAKIFENPIVTAISPEAPFYLAEEDHHNYYNENGMQPYCRVIIDPKIKKLYSHFAEQLKEEYK